MNKTLKVYLNAEKTVFQVIRPTALFVGNDTKETTHKQMEAYRELACAIANSNKPDFILL